MLSATSTEVVKATLPAIGAAIGEITTTFYQRLFAAHPELERDLFNRGNQAQGDQQRALAGAVAAYATLLVSDNAPAPADLLGRIANKHASLGITEAQYQVVHQHLFEAIVEVLGEAVTPDVAAAWDEVYWLMAGDLIAAEKKLYAAAGVDPPQVWRTVTVRDRIQESPDTVSFVLRSPDGEALPTARPGQYVSVACTMPDGARQIRQYSLIRSDRDEWEISVKAIAASVAADGSPMPAGEVSNFLHREVFEGDRLTVSPPFGDLVLDDTDAPLVLVSAGIGSTPILGMLHYLTHTGTSRTVMVLHADRSPARHAHRQELKDLVDQLPGATLHRWYEDLGARPSSDYLLAGLVDLDAVDLPIEARAYLCGPLPFMELVHRSLVARGVPESHIHYEVFGPDSGLGSD